MPENVVELKEICKTYRAGSLAVPVLKNVQFSIYKGEFVGIMGSSGSGKSTLLNILGLLDVPSSGQYFLNDIEVEHLSDNNLAALRNKYIGFIFQSFNLSPHLNVQENIEVPLVYGEIPRKKRHEIAAGLANRVGLGHRLHHRPTELSGGECQRVAVARALSTSPAFLLADEPTGNLDEKTGAEILSLFHEIHIQHNTTIIMVTHNQYYESHFGRIIRLRDGSVAN